MEQNSGQQPGPVPGTAPSSWMAPDSGAPPISALRAYAEVLIMFALVFASGIINAAESLGGNNVVPSGSWGAFAPATVDEVCTAAVIVIAIVLLAARRGVTGQLLGIRVPQALPGVGRTSRAIRMAAMGLLAFVAGAIVTSQLAGGHHYPQPAHPSVPFVVYSVGGSLFSGVVEEMVALAFVASTLRQARRPAAEIVIVAVLLRCSYHIYYGAGIVGVVVWSTVFALLYLRFRSVIPLIVLHVLWDSSLFMGLKWQFVSSLAYLLGLGLVITAFIMWIVAIVNHRDAKHPRYGGFAPYPGALYPVPPYQGVPYPGAPSPGWTGQPWPAGQPSPAYPQSYGSAPFQGYAGPPAPPARPQSHGTAGFPGYGAPPVPPAYPQNPGYPTPAGYAVPQSQAPAPTQAAQSDQKDRWPDW